MAEVFLADEHAMLNAEVVAILHQYAAPCGDVQCPVQVGVPESGDMIDNRQGNVRFFLHQAKGILLTAQVQEIVENCRIDSGA